MRLSVFDSTRATVVTPEVLLVDTARQPFNLVVKQFRNISDCGLWLNPFRGNPQAFGSSPLDIVYIDDHYKVLGYIENFQTAAPDGTQERAASALAYPSGTIRSATLQPGDQLRFCDAATGVLWASEVAGFYEEHAGIAGEKSESRPAQRGARDNGSVGASTPSVAVRRAVENLRANAEAESRPQPEPSRLKRFMRWFLDGKEEPAEPRRAERRAVSGLVAYFWTGGNPQAFEVANISTQGFYLLTRERWMPGTKILVTLQTIGSGASTDNRVTVPSRVARTGPDGVGFEYVASEAVNLNTGGIVPSTPEDRARLERFLRQFMQ